MYKKLCIFAAGLGIGAIGGYCFFKYREYQNDKIVEKEIKDLRAQHDRLVEKINEYDEMCNAIEKKYGVVFIEDKENPGRDKIIVSTEKKAKSEERKATRATLANEKKRVPYHNIKPSLEKLVRETYGEDDPDLNKIREREIERQLMKADAEGKTEVEVIVPGPGSTVTERHLGHEVVSYDDDLPVGYSEEILTYYIGNDALIVDETQDEVYNKRATIGEEAYDLCKQGEGEVYVLNHDEGVLYGINSVEGCMVQPEEDIDDEEEPMQVPPNKYKAIIKETEKYENFVRKSRAKNEE